MSNDSNKIHQKLNDKIVEIVENAVNKSNENISRN